MPGLFAMKRESWARLVRVSSLPRYAPSRRIAKGLSLSLSFFSLDHGRNNIAAARPRKRLICPFPTPLSLPTLERRASLITSGRNKRRPSPPDEFFPGVEWSGVERGGGYPRHLDPVSVHGTSGRPVLPCRPPAENFQVHRAESPSSLTVTGWNLGNVFVPLRVAEGMRNVWRF